MTALLDIQRHGPVARVFLNRPEVRNAFNDAVIAELGAAFAAFADDATLRCVVLGAHGRAFCAGADLGWMRAMGGYSWEDNRADAQRLADMLWLLWSCPVPVVGRIQGDCYAGGVGLAAVCDVVVASDAAGFCLSEAKLGLLPATIGPYVLRAIGAAQARRWFVTAERFDAATARAIGLVHELVPAAGGEAALAEALDAAVQRIVQAVVDNGPQAVRACKQLVRDLSEAPIDHRLREDTARRIADIRGSAEGREGVEAFLQRRPPAWRGDAA